MKYLGTEITDEEARIHDFFGFPLTENDSPTNAYSLLKNSTGNALIKFESPMSKDLQDLFLKVINGEVFLLRMRGVKFSIVNEWGSDYLSMNNTNILKFASIEGFRNCIRAMMHQIPDEINVIDFRWYFMKMIESRFSKLIEINNNGTDEH
jgi:hypothetical protein